MHLAFICDPTSTHSIKWIEYFIGSGYEVDVLGWNQPLAGTLLGARYHHLPEELRPAFHPAVHAALWKIGLGDLALARQIRQLLNQIQPDIVTIIHVPWGQLPAALGSPKPLILRPGGFDLLVLPNEYKILKRALLKHVMRKADLVLCNSDILASASTKYGARQERVKRFEQLVDFDRFHPGVSTGSVREEYNLPEGTPVLFSLRSLRPKYCIHTLVEALPLVLEHYPDLVVVQVSLTPDPDYFAQVQSRISALGLQKVFRYVGRVPYERMPALFALSDICVSIPDSDGRPSSVVEAMACGIPVVAGDIPQAHEFIVNRKNGLLVPVEDVAATAQAILKLLDDADLRQKIAAQALKDILDKGGIQEQMQMVGDLYLKTLRIYNG